MTQNTAETLISTPTLALLEHLNVLSPADQDEAALFIDRGKYDEVVLLLRNRLEAEDRGFINRLCSAYYPGRMTWLWPWKFLQEFRTAKAKRGPVLDAWLVWATYVGRHQEARTG